MQGIKLWLSPAGAAIAAIGFFLPWFYIGCQPVKDKKPVLKIQVSGLQLATGKKPAQVQEFFTSFLYKITVQPVLTKYQKKTGRKLRLFAERWLLWGVFLSALVALFLGFQIATQEPSPGKKIGGIIASLAGFGFLIAGLLQHAPSRSRGSGGGSFKIPDTIIYGLSPGGAMLIGGLLLALIGFLVVKGKKEEKEEKEAEEGAKETAQSPTS